MASQPITSNASSKFVPPRVTLNRSVVGPMPRLPLPLSARSLTAIGIADAIRLGHDRVGIDTDHLFLGLFADPAGAARRGMASAGIDERTLIERFRVAGLDAVGLPVTPDGEVQPRWPAPTPGEPRPPVSVAVERVLYSAAAVARAQTPPSPIVEPEHVLAALHADDDNPVIPLLSDAWPHIAGLLLSNGPATAAVGDTPVVRELSDENLQELVQWLSVSARKALGVADALRRARNQPAVHMEHLLVGLHVQSGGHQHERLTQAGLNAADIRSRLAKFELALETTSGTAESPRFAVPTAEQIDTMPPLSGHARRALSAAAMLGGWAPGTALPDGVVIQARLLLAGWFAVRECSVVKALEDQRGVVRDIVRAQIRTDTVPSEEWRNALLARLDALLGEPPRVVWQPLSEPKADSRTGIGGGGTNDLADGIDRLRFGDYVSAFADLIDSPDTNPPLTIGIFGAWGAGKSFLLQKLIATMEARRKVPRDAASANGRAPVYTVAFNAWEYNAAPQIWPRLVRRVLDSVESSLDWKMRTRSRLRRLWPNLRRKAGEDWKSILAWFIIVTVLVLLAQNATETATSVFQFTIGKTIEKLTFPGLVGALVSLAALLVRSFIAPLGEWITAALDDGRSYGLESVAMAIVRKDLERLDGRLKSEHSRLLIVIDDLDRCEPEKAVEMLQAINLLLDRPSFVICLGIDARVVTAAVEQHYRDTLGRAGITGYEYLDKIVQIPFTIPEPTGGDLLVFLDGQLNRKKDESPAETRQPAPPLPATSPGGDVSASTGSSDLNKPGNGPPDRAPTARVLNAPIAVPQAPVPPAESFAALSFSDDEKTAFGKVSPYMRRNPRHVKRLVNVYTLVRSLATRRAEQRILADPESTILWLTLCAQWPYSLTEMLRNFEVQAAAPTKPALPALRVLYDAAAASIIRGRQRRFDHDVATLIALVDASGALDWEEIRVLRFYTENFNPAIEGELRVDRRHHPRTGRSRQGSASSSSTSETSADRTTR